MCLKCGGQVEYNECQDCGNYGRGEAITEKDRPAEETDVEYKQWMPRQKYNLPLSFEIEEDTFEFEATKRKPSYLSWGEWELNNYEIGD